METQPPQAALYSQPSSAGEQQQKREQQKVVGGQQSEVVQKNCEPLTWRRNASEKTSNRSRSQERVEEKKEEEATTTATNTKQSATKLHEWLTKEIKSKFAAAGGNNSTEVGKKSGSSGKNKSAADSFGCAQQVLEGGATGASSAGAGSSGGGAEAVARANKKGGAASFSLLDALIEGRKSWLEEKTVIVDIKNHGSSNKRQQQKRQQSTEKILANEIGQNQVESVVFEKFRQLKDEDSLGLEVKDKDKDKVEVEDKVRIKGLEKASTNNSSTLAAKGSGVSSSHKSSSAKQQQQREEDQLSSRDQEKGERVESEEKEEEEDSQRRIFIKKGKKKLAEERQQHSIDDQQLNNKSRANNPRPIGPPTFGTTPLRLSSARLPYFSYYGKARNVNLVSSADRPATNQRSQSKLNKQHSGSSSGSSGSNNEEEESSSVDNTSNHSLSSATAVGQSRIPTLSRTSALGGGAKSQRYQPGYQLSEIDQEDSRELELDRRQRLGRHGRATGYSNISNLFPNQPQRVRGRSVESTRAKSSASQLRVKDLRFGGSQLGNSSKNTHNSNLSPENDDDGDDNENNNDNDIENDNEQSDNNNKRNKLQQSASLLNLSSQRAAANSHRQATQTKVSTTGAPQLQSSKNSLTLNSSKGTYNNTYRVRNRSMNSLNNAHTQQQQLNNQTMRRQNSSATPTGKRSAVRSGSVTGSYLRGHHRTPSTNSLHYAGSAGVSPYGPTPVDPDCPVHGYPPPPIGGPLSKSSQHLAADPDLLYEPQYGPGYYDRAGGLKQSASLYSPTSPNLLGSRPGSAYVSPSGRNSVNAGALANPTAYYNSSSRFSMYHSPGAAGGRTSLAPTNEQLRRILGYQPHTKPIYLHPQWAYSRPFIHLQGTRSPSPNSPTLGELDGEDQDLGPHFEPYNQLQDTQAIRAVDFHPSGEVYAIGSNSRALRICAYPADYELRHFGQDHVTTAPRILFKFLQVHRGSIYCVSFNSAGQLLATGSNDQTVHIVRYNSVTHSPDGDEYRLTMHDGTVRDVCFIDDATNSSSLLLSAGGGDNKIYVTDCDTITPFQSMAGHTQMVMGLHHWAGANFVSASYDRTIRFWDLRTRVCTSIISAPPSYGTGGKWAGPGAPVCSVKVDPSGRLLASGHTDSTCMLYDIRGARIIQAFKPHDDEIRTLSFSPKSYYLLTGGYDGRIVLSDLQGDLTQPLPSVCVAENDDKIVQAKWHPSDFTFVTTSADKSATLWAMPTE